MLHGRADRTNQLVALPGLPFAEDALAAELLVLVLQQAQHAAQELVHLVLVLVVQYWHRVEDQDHCWASLC